MKKKEHKKIFLWICLIALMSVCVYCSFPRKIQPDVSALQNQNADEPVPDSSNGALEVEDIIEAYFKGRPVRDVPENADFAAFLKGTFAKQHQDFEQLANSYEKVLLSDPENKEIQTSLFLYFVLAGNVQKANTYAEQALNGDKTKPLAQIVILSENIKQRKYQESFRLVQELDRTYHGFLRPVAQAWLFVSQGKLNDALQSLDAIKTTELNGLYLLYKGAMLDYFDKTKQAAEAYNELLQTKDFNNVRVLMVLKEFDNRTRLLTDKKKMNDAYAALENESFVSKEMMSQNKTGERIRTPEAGIAWAFFDVASALVSGGDYKAALFFAQLARYLNPSSSVIQLFVGEILETMEILPQANKLYAEVTPAQNIYLSSRVRIVLNLIKSHQLDQAESVMDELIQHYPALPLFYMTKADIEREQGAYEQALTDYQKALNLVAKDDKQVAPIYFYQGLCYEALDNPAKALLLFERALKLDSQNPVYLNYVGYLWVEENKNVPEALKMIETANTYLPNDGGILDSLGRAYFVLKNYDKSLFYLEKAVALESGNATINSHLGDVYWKLKRYREARFQWAHAKTLKQGVSKKLLSELTDKMENGLPK